MAGCTWDGNHLSLAAEHLAQLPKEIVTTLQEASNPEYLDTLAELALEPNWTETIFSRYQPLFVEFCGRWLQGLETERFTALACVSALSRIFPHAPHLNQVVDQIANYKRLGVFKALGPSAKPTAILQFTESTLCEILLFILRVLPCHDDERLASLVSPAQLQLLLSHEALHIRFMACKVFCMVFHFTDKVLFEMVEKYVGSVPLEAKWEDRIIDYRFIDLWEAKRIKNLEQLLESVPKACSPTVSAASVRVILPADLSPLVFNFADYLAVAFNKEMPITDSLILTPATSTNLARTARALCESRAVLVSSLAGEGKTTIIRAIAQSLNQLPKLLTLHLNEQTDPKLLIGLYTSSVESGSFKWQPGVLTKAVQQGHWVLIENLDRAPKEVVSILLPLLERQELMVPNLGGTVHAADGFKLISTTVRSSLPRDSEEFVPTDGMIGDRFWRKVKLHPYNETDLQQIVDGRFPLLLGYCPRFLSMYNKLIQLSRHSIMTQRSERVYGLQQLLRYCSRVDKLLKEAGISSDGEAIPEVLLDDIFLEAVDCFSSALPNGVLKDKAIELIAQELHVPETRKRFCLAARIPRYEVHQKRIRLGRVTLRRSQVQQPIGAKTRSQPFAATNHALKTMERIGVAVKSQEPCLLVGETGIGKTALVQELASLLGQKLVVVNLSQQSEAGDLLGGFKPVNIRSLATPIKDEFDLLFEETFSTAKNERYLKSVNRTFRKSEWTRVLTLWHEALKRIEITFATGFRQHDADNPQKKRKIETAKYQRLKYRWKTLATQVSIFGKHLQSGSKGFAFSFMEGNIIKAVRNGHWVLLDEINLASSDTLESIADLLVDCLDVSPSLLLTETGVVERVRAHSEFRIFGAMNPNDVGKKDLPPSLRARFTEYFVSSPEEDPESLLQIVKAYLEDEANRDPRLAQEVVQLYLKIRSLENSNRLVDGANQRPHFTLRSLTRTLTYGKDVAHLFGIRRALFEGFAMTFLTVLDQQSANVVSPEIFEHLLGSHKNSRALLHQVPRCPGKPDDFIQFRHHWMPRGPFPISPQPHYVITPFVEANLLNLVRATSTRRYPILLEGPTASGKTSMLEYLANLSGNNFVRINNHEHTDLQEYLGTYISDHHGLHFQEGILVRALREGHWLVLDELNLAPTDVLEALNRLLDDNRELFIPETQELVRPHPSFMLFATQNAAGVYAGRKVLSRAFRNRLLELHFDDIPEGELETILRERSQIAPSYCRRIVAVYKKLSVLRQSNRLFEQKNSFATLRDLFRWALRPAENVYQLAKNGFMLLAERVRDPEERDGVRHIIEEVMHVTLHDHEIYDAATISGALHSADSPEQVKNIVLTKSMIRLLTLMSSALKNNEPVLLVGDTGCGKTMACQVIAELFGTELNILNAHENTETGDIIGSQRPIRNTQQLEASFRKDFELAAGFIPLPSPGSTPDLKELFNAYQSLPPNLKQQIPLELRQRLEENGSKASSLFAWSDGALVRSMRAGCHFLLDEVNLAEDSVLERMNSVLEPSRTILLAEKGSLDSFVKAHENFQFLATMNAGGEVGKKELSPALRNRFTEVWIPQLSDDEDVLQIVTSKLSAHLSSLAKPIVSFSRWFCQQYENSGHSSVLRRILSWVEFLNISNEASLPFSIVNGAALVYIDSLGASPSGKATVLRDTISEERQHCLDSLSSIFAIDASSVYFRPVRFEITSTEVSLGSFNVGKRGQQSKTQEFSFDNRTTVMNATRIARAMQLSKPILIEGAPGVGKSTLVNALAGIVGARFTRINLSEQTDLMDLFGSDVPIENGEIGQFQWRDAPFLQAMQRGDWILLDELNLASQSVLEGLNACLDHRGQVYVPELDQVFSRHPDFKVFAAQNPASQGSSRKHLPASFVDRFTVVYADAFLEEDMLSISAQLFPNVSVDHVHQIVRFISGLNACMTGRGSLSISEQPLEFNLRDVLRWVHLLNSKTSLFYGSKPFELEGPLVLNRLRSEESIRQAGQVIRSLANVETNNHNSFMHTDPSSLQCGYGYLEKREVASCLPSRCARHEPRLIESVLIAIQENWPCLLVGPSEKSSLIRDLAATFGARISTISLSADMDAMDLVGGYEQVDYQRHLAKFNVRLDEALKNYLAKQILRHASLEDDFTELEVLSTGVQLNLTRASDVIRRLADKDPQIFRPLLEQCLEIAQQSSIDSRARFEWVDSPLVNAMENGHWLILENANLCSSSVLDRLNALLEPNGVLSVNEHRSADGSPHRVQPGASFRIFLTMDARHGEISRAMTNRCLELYISEVHEDKQGGLTLFDTDCQTSRFRIADRFEWVSMSDEDSIHMLRLCLDHLALSDSQLVQAWEKEISKGLVSLTPQRSHMLHWTARAFQQIANHDTTKSAIESLYRSMFSGMHSYQSSSQLALAQPLNPLNNGPLVSQLRRTGNMKKAEWIADMLDCFFTLAHLRDQLEILSQANNPDWRTTMNRLERSVLASRSRAFSKDSTLPLHQFFLYILEAVESWSSLVLGSNHEFKEYPRAVADYVTDLFDVSQTQPFDESKFQAYLRLGKSIARSLQLQGFPAELGRSLKIGLDSFDEMWALTTGLGMHNIWTFFRPITPPDINNLRRIQDLEAVADKLESNFWKSNSTFQSIITLRTSLSHALMQLKSNQDRIDDESLLHPQEPSEFKEMLQFADAVDGPLTSTNYQSEAYLHDDFECLRQYVSSHRVQNASEKQNILDLLAGRRIKDVVSSPSSPASNVLLSRLPSSTGIDTESCQLAALKGTLPLTVIQKYSRMSETPLRYLSRLSEEVSLFNNQIANATEALDANQWQCLRSLLSTLVPYILEAHSNLLEPSSRHEWTHFLQGPKHATMPRPLLMCQPSEASEAESNLIALFEQTASQYFYPVLSYLQGDTKDCQVSMASEAWIKVFLGMLRLYVPNAPNDPAVTPLIEAERWVKRKRELDVQLKTLTTFEQKTTGANTSLRCEIVRERRANLGDRPSMPAIVRPSISRMIDLQAEFNRVREIAIRPCEKLLLSSSKDDDVVCTINSNIGHIISRLADGYREYEDLTSPLIGMLRGLAIGLTLRLARTSPQNSSNSNISPDSNLTVLGLDIGETTHFLQTQSCIGGLGAFDRNTVSLEYLVLEKGSLGHLSLGSVKKATGILHLLFQHWKGKLQVEQAQLASKSSLYHYKGESEATFDDQKELASLFPNIVEYQAADQQTQNRPQESPQAFVKAIANLHWRLFSCDSQTKNPAIDFAREVTSKLHLLDPNTMAFPSARAASLMPIMILAMDEARNSVLTDCESVKPSFYQDSNIGEINKLVSLLRKLRTRIQAVQASWPEHETLKEILKTTEELLDVKFSVPLVSIVPKTEKLHSFVNEWQQVANREFSVQLCFDELTRLLISWRRLELSTWAKILDREDENHVEEAKAWWFVAYESIFSPFLESLDSELDPKDYLEGLVAELQKFVRTAPIGQFAARLQMLEAFHQHAKYLSQSAPTFHRVSDALANTLGYFKRWSRQVSARISAHRDLSKEKMDEVLRLASWKDTNVLSLRESARKSHHALLKVIRKYRELLCQESASLFQEVLSTDIPRSNPIEGMRHKLCKSLDKKALEICRQNFPTWSQRASRLEDPMRTAVRMSQVAAFPSSELNSQLFLSSFRTNLLEAIQTLQDETPKKLTHENKSQVKHLKARKRNLLADTLKQIHQMGVRSNLDFESLRNQASTEKVLSSSPFHPELFGSDQDFLTFVDQMPLARQAAKQHSQDLTSGEANRSLGFLEGLLYHLMKQRKSLGEALLELKVFDESLTSIDVLWNPKEYQVAIQDAGSASTDQYVERLAWLQAIISGTRCVIEKLEIMGGNDFSILGNAIRSRSDVIVRLQDFARTLPSVPYGLTTSVHRTWVSDVDNFLTDFSTDINQWSTKFPGARFVLKYLQPWPNMDAAIHLSRVFPSTKASFEIGNVTNRAFRTEHGYETDDTEVYDAVDSMLVGIQSLKKTLADLPASSEDVAWLVREERLLHKSTRGLRLGEVTAQINKCLLSRVQDCEVDKLKTICALCAAVSPILHQYRDSFFAIIEKRVRTHNALCELAPLLSKTFNNLASQGFCSPQESSDEQTKSGKMEEGVGLGDGEGAEDISKDIGEDEDLSEAAQEPQLEKSKSDEQTEGNDDAIDVQDEDLTDGMEDAAEGATPDDNSELDQASEREEMTDEIGEVDDLDPAAVDEKLWSGTAKDANSEREGNKTKGEKSGDFSAQKKLAEDRQMSEAEENEDPGNETDGKVPQLEAEPMDLTTEEGESLELPDDAIVDGRNSPKDTTDDEDLHDISDVGMSDNGSVRSTDVSEEDAEMHEFGESAKNNDDTLGEEEEGHDETFPAQLPNSDQEDSSAVDDKHLLEDLSANTATSDAMQADQLRGSGLQHEEQEMNNGLPTKNSQDNGNSSRDVPMPDLLQEPLEAERGHAEGPRRRSLDATQNEQDATSDVEQQPFRKLGEALERWHRANRAVRNPAKEQTENSREGQTTPSVEFEHLKDENDKADAQALDTATDEEAKALKQNQLEVEEPREPTGLDETNPQERYSEAMDIDYELESANEGPDTGQSDVRTTTNRQDTRDDLGRSIELLSNDEDDAVEYIDNELSEVQLGPESSPHRSAEEARRLWSVFEKNTRDLSVSLTEQLRLILAPSQATKMRGDFRTGKRLNIKRIIPYIASQYKRDKIWMRRSIPSKRKMQIMIAVDDSQSMGESGSGRLAFASLALVARSLSALEAGQLCIASFGDNFQVAHPFEQEFSSESAVGVIQHFKFEQSRTNIANLLQASLNVFRQARARQTSSGADIWQLQIIISDGVCEDHDYIKRLGRQAHEERIVIVFVIVNASSGHSILDMTQANFEPDPETGETQLRIKPYLDQFPFTYYLIVRDIKSLPHALSTTLRQWLAEVSHPN